MHVSCFTELLTNWCNWQRPFARHLDDSFAHFYAIYWNVGTTLIKKKHERRYQLAQWTAKRHMPLFLVSLE